jgi:hypothetical protein
MHRRVDEPAEGRGASDATADARFAAPFADSEYG